MRNLMFPHRTSTPRLRSALRQAMIAQAAYFRAEHCGIKPGHEREDWVSAEKGIDRFLVRGFRILRGLTNEACERETSDNMAVSEEFECDDEYGG